MRVEEILLRRLLLSVETPMDAACTPGLCSCCSGQKLFEGHSRFCFGSEGHSLTGWVMTPSAVWLPRLKARDQKPYGITLL